MTHLPPDFLLGPPPPVTVRRIDFAQAGIPEYAPLHATVLDGVLTPSECDALVRAAEAHADAAGTGWERAMVNNGRYTQRLCTELRNSGRIIWDDAEVVARLWARVGPHVPDIRRLEGNARILGNGPVRRRETWLAAGLNERMRFLRYGPGEYFGAHGDGAFERPDGSQRSYFTLHLYLNGRDAANPLAGGATTFHATDMRREHSVYPRPGRVLLFQHRGLWHSGQEVDEGVKMTLRTDVMFMKEAEAGEDEGRMKEG